MEGLGFYIWPGFEVYMRSFFLIAENSAIMNEPPQGPPTHENLKGFEQFQNFSIENKFFRNWISSKETILN